MAGTVEITPRPIYLQDLAETAVPGTTDDSVEVLGAGPMTLTRIPITLLTQLVSAANDAAAGVAGVLVGEVYVLSTTSKLRTRMT